MPSARRTRAEEIRKAQDSTRRIARGASVTRLLSPPCGPEARFRRARVIQFEQGSLKSREISCASRVNVPPDCMARFGWGSGLLPVAVETRWYARGGIRMVECVESVIPRFQPRASLTGLWRSRPSSRRTLEYRRMQVLWTDPFPSYQLPRAGRWRKFGRQHRSVTIQSRQD